MHYYLHLAIKFYEVNALCKAGFQLISTSITKCCDDIIISELLFALIFPYFFILCCTICVEFCELC
jgi:hypothetical protein